MATIRVHAGDWPAISVPFSQGRFFLRADKGFKLTQIPASEIETLEDATSEAVERLGGKIGWGVAGAVLLGPVGLLAGLLAGGKRHETTFVARFRDGSKILASTDSRTFTKIRAATGSI